MARTDAYEAAPCPPGCFDRDHLLRGHPPGTPAVPQNVARALEEAENRVTTQYMPKEFGSEPWEPWWLVLNPDSAAYVVTRVAEETIWKHGEDEVRTEVRERVIDVMARTDRVPGPVLAEVEDDLGISRTFVAVSA